MMRKSNGVRCGDRAAFVCFEHGRLERRNGAVSAANAALYALVHAALLAGGWSPGLGFLHSGNARAFVFDVADLYKADTSLPVAFAAAAESADGVEKRVRAACVGRFWAAGLPGRVFDDVKEILDDPAPPAQSTCKDPRHVEQLDA